MDDKLMRELVNELSSALEGVEAQSLAVLGFLKAQKKGADKLVPYLEQAEKTSSVKWMATRARLNHLLDGAAKEAERAAEESAEVQMKPQAKVEGGSESEDTKSKEPAGPREKVGTSARAVEPQKSEDTEPGSASQTTETQSPDKPNTVQSTNNQADRKPLSEKQSDHPKESAA